MLIFTKLTLFQPRTEIGIIIRILEDTNNFDVISENMKMDCWDYGDHAAVLYQTQFCSQVIKIAVTCNNGCSRKYTHATQPCYNRVIVTLYVTI